MLHVIDEPDHTDSEVSGVNVNQDKKDIGDPPLLPHKLDYHAEKKDASKSIPTSQQKSIVSFMKNLSYIYEAGS